MKRLWSSLIRPAIALQPAVSQFRPNHQKPSALNSRCPDASANPYLAFSAMLMAGLDGIQKQIDPGLPSEMDLFEGDALKNVKLG